MALDTETIKSLCEKHWNLGSQPDIPRNFLQLSETKAAKIGDLIYEDDLRHEYAWLEYCAPLVDDKLVVLPKPHGPLITHGDLTIPVMDFIGGVEVDDMLKDGQKLSDDDASRICDAYLALRRAIKPKTDELCPSGSWYLKSHIFKPWRDGGIVKYSREEFHSYMDDRLTRAYDGDKTMFPRDEIVWNHGDLSPSNLKLLDDGRIGFYDLESAVWGPPDWDLFALLVGPYDAEFVAPLERAFHTKGLKLREDRKEMYRKFMFWHFRMGNPAARDEQMRERLSEC